MMRVLLTLSAVLLSALLLTRPALAHPFEQGRVRISAGGGYAFVGEEGYFSIGGSGGYFVLDGLEVGADVMTFLGPQPNITSLSPRITWTIWQIPVVHPYGGGFWSHWFVAQGQPDFDTVGFRFGVQIRAGSRAIVTGGIRREIQVPVCYLKGCSSWTPEFGVSFIF
jgi:hypothetical protein